MTGILHPQQRTVILAPSKFHMQNIWRPKVTVTIFFSQILKNINFCPPLDQSYPEENSRHFVEPPLVSPRMTSEERAQKFQTDDVWIPHLFSASDWSCRERNLLQPIKSTNQIWIVTSHHYRISALVAHTSFHGETSGGVAKCRLFSQVKPVTKCQLFLPTSATTIYQYFCLQHYIPADNKIAIWKLKEEFKRVIMTISNCALSSSLETVGNMANHLHAVIDQLGSLKLQWKQTGTLKVLKDH